MIIQLYPILLSILVSIAELLVTVRSDFASNPPRNVAKGIG